MTRVRCSVVVDGDPATVFDYVCDPNESRRWQRDLLSRVQATPAAGALTWHEMRTTLRSRGRPVEVSLTTQSRPDVIEFVATSGPLRAVGALTFQRDGSRTRIVQRTDIHGRGITALLVPLVARHVKRVGQANLFRLTMHMRAQAQSASAS